VGSAGRTGHDYPNQWEGNRLRWFAKTGTRIDQPQMRDVLNPQTEVHILWRADNDRPFVYAGLATVADVRDTSPVEVVWAFPPIPLELEYRGGDEVSSKVSYVEGAARTITVNAFERNTAARRECLAHHGDRCQVCDLSFEERYGDIGRGFIHVHHVVPIAALSGEYTVDPIHDLIPVCPNCHAILHRYDPPMTVEQLRKVFQPVIAEAVDTSGD
jgi:5-methylcytosine-specific restriction enzyme A